MSAVFEEVNEVDHGCYMPQKYDPVTSGVTGFLIDLDGTMYRPDGLIEGAKDFYEWLVNTGKPFVFLSNTGAKGSIGTQAKFKKSLFQLDTNPVSLKHIWTASEAQIQFMMHKRSDTPNTRFANVDMGIPEKSKVFVLEGGGTWFNDLRMKDALRLDSWDVRTSLTDDEAKEWAEYALHTHNKGEPRVFVCLFLDGSLETGAEHEEKFGKGESTAYEPDWSFSLLKKVSWILHNGGQLIYTADDAFNPSLDNRHKGMTFPSPGPGMFAALFKYLMAPLAEGQTVCAGKGGTHGDVFMMEHGIQMLKAQGHSGERSQIMMIGDRFDTDIRGGCTVGIKTCLVESGAHKVCLQPRFPKDKATYFAPSVAYLINRVDRKNKEELYPSPMLPSGSYLSLNSRKWYAGRPGHEEGVMVTESSMLLEGAKKAAAEFKIHTQTISQLNNDAEVLDQQLNISLSQVTADLGGTRPHLAIIFSAASSEKTAALLKKASQKWGEDKNRGPTPVHALSTYYGVMSDKGVSDEIGIWALKDPSAKVATGFCTESDPHQTPKQMANKALLNALANWTTPTGGQKVSPQFVLLSSSCGEEEVIIQELQRVFQENGFPAGIPFLGGTAAPPNGDLESARFVGGVSGTDVSLSKTDGNLEGRGVIVTLVRVPGVRNLKVVGSLFPKTLCDPVPVTKVKGTRCIQSINGISAKDWYLNEIAKTGNVDVEALTKDPFLTSLQPLSVVVNKNNDQNSKEEDGEGEKKMESGSVVHVRNVHIRKIDDEDGSLETFADVELNALIQISQGSVEDLANPAQHMHKHVANFIYQHEVHGALCLTCMGCTHAMLQRSKVDKHSSELATIGGFRESLSQVLGGNRFVAGSTMGEQAFVNGTNIHGNLMYTMILFGTPK